MRCLNRALAAAAAFIPLVMGGCFVTGCDLATVTEVRLTETAHAATDAVEIHTRNGSVTVEQDDEAAQATISTELRARDHDRLAQMTVSVEHRPDGTLALEVEPPNGQWLSGEGASFEVTLPGASGVTIRSGNGAVRISGLAGAADLDSSNGRIEVTDHAGDVRAGTSNGALVLRDVRGSVDATTSNGSIEAEGIVGWADLSTSNGDVTLDLDDSSPGPVTLVTSNGTVDLRVGMSFKGTLEASTSNGRLTLDGADRAGARIESSSKRSVRFSLGEGGPDSSVRTSNGRVTIRFPG